MRTAGVAAVSEFVHSANFPLPVGDLPAGTSPSFLVGTPSSHPSDVIEVVLRRAGGLARVVRGYRVAGMAHDATQWFKAQLPVIEPGAHEEYRVEWRRAGRHVATLPADGSCYAVHGIPGARTAESSASTSGGGYQASRPRFAYELDFFAALTVNLRAEVLGATPEGYRINFFVNDGRVAGPGIDATVEPQGGDWMCIRPDGIGAVNIKITYRTHDGALILESAGGVFDIGPDGYARVASGRLDGAPPFYATPTWSTAHPAWTWLNRCQGVGFGRVVMDTLQVQCDIYIPRVGERIAGG